MSPNNNLNLQKLLHIAILTS